MGRSTKIVPYFIKYVFFHPQSISMHINIIFENVPIFCFFRGLETMLPQVLNPQQLHQDVDHLYFLMMNIVMMKTTILNAIGMVVLVVAIPFPDGILIVQTVNALIPMLAQLLLLQNAKMNGLRRNV